MTDEVTMSNKLRGVELQNCKTPIAEKWAQIAGDPEYKGSLILMHTSKDYFFFGEDAKKAAQVLGKTLRGKNGPLPQMRIKSTDARLVYASLRNASCKVVICGDESSKLKGHWRAYVDVTMGDRRVSNFMANAGLGITGARTKERLVLNYSPGEVVDEDRVNAAMETMIAMADAEGAAFKILTYKVAKLEFIVPICVENRFSSHPGL